MSLTSSCTAHCLLKTYCHTYADAASTGGGVQQSRQDMVASLTSFSATSSASTFFSKSFSPFPHGTCLLSALTPCVALDEAYHQHCAPIPSSVTLRMCTVHSGLPLTNGTLTLAGTRFQETYSSAAVGSTSLSLACALALSLALPLSRSVSPRALPSPVAPIKGATKRGRQEREREGERGRAR